MAVLLDEAPFECHGARDEWPLIDIDTIMRFRLRHICNSVPAISIWLVQVASLLQMHMDGARGALLAAGTMPPMMATQSVRRGPTRFGANSQAARPISGTAEAEYTSSARFDGRRMFGIVRHLSRCILAGGYIDRYFDVICIVDHVGEFDDSRHILARMEFTFDASHTVGIRNGAVVVLMMNDYGVGAGPQIIAGSTVSEASDPAFSRFAIVQAIDCGCWTIRRQAITSRQISRQ